MLRTCTKWHHVNAMTFVPRACFFYARAHYAYPIFNRRKNGQLVSLSATMKKDSNAISINLPHCVCALFIFSCYLKSLRYSRVRNDNSMMPFVTRACFFVHVHKKFAYWPWSWHLFRSTWPSFRMLAFLCTTLVFQELMKKRSLKKVFCLLAFFVLVHKKFAFSSGTFVPFTPCYVRVRNGIMFTLWYVRVSV